MIARHSSSPAAFARVERFQIACSIDNVLFRLHHFSRRVEIGAVIVEVHLHAAKVDENLSLPRCLLKFPQSICLRIGDDGSTFYVQRIGMKTAFYARLCETNRIENSERHLFRFRDCGQIALTDFGIIWPTCGACLRDKSRQIERQGQADRQQPLSDAFRNCHRLCSAHYYQCDPHLGPHLIQTAPCFRECHAVHCHC